MKSRTSSRPQRRLTKASKDDLLRSKTPTAADGVYHHKASHDEDSAPVRASYESLVLTAESRQLLREQLTSTFPETASPEQKSLARWPSRDGLSRFGMGRKDKVPKSMSLSNVNDMPAEEPALSPTLSFHTARVRLSTLPESAIDVEAAISLLQELKKKASPEELVALHRALLPVKEVETSPEPYEHDYYTAGEYKRQSASRRRSNIPPGLATRGGPEDDPLRRYGEIRRRPVSAIVLPEPQRVSVLSTTSEQLASRPFTPDDDFPDRQAGVYRTGTLRITNGSASPASSLHFRESFEIQDAKEIKIIHPMVTSHDLQPLKNDIDALDFSSSDDNHSYTPTRASFNEDAEHLEPAMRYPQEPNVLHFEEPAALKPEEPVHFGNAMDEYNEFCGNPYDRKVSSQTHRSDSSGDDSIEQPFMTPKASMADIKINHEFHLPELQFPGRPGIGHTDSGYGSESSMALQKREEDRTPVKIRPLEDQRWLTVAPNMDPDTASARHSLYTLDQIINSPSILGAEASTEEATPSPRSTKRPNSRRTTLFSLGRNKSQSTKTLAEASVSDVSTPASIDAPTPEKEEPQKKSMKKSKSKKLKKAVPHHIRQARKELQRFEEAAAAESMLTVQKVEEPIPEPVEPEPQRESCDVPVQDSFKMRAPHAYARIMAAETAMQQARLRPYNDSPVLHYDQPRELQSSLSNAMSDDTDNTSIINFRAVARSLGASPYDVSTSQFKSSIDYIAGSENKWRIQSPFEIGQGIPGPKTLGMDEKAASELARKKSRDYVEPERQDEPADRTSTSPRLQGPRRPYSTNGQNMPPMPDLPLDIESKARKADEMVTRRLADVNLPVETDHHVEEPKTLVTQKPTASPVDWNAQARIWRERRQALGHALHQPEDEEASSSARSSHLSPEGRNTNQALSLDINRASSVSPAQITLNNARAAMQERMSSPVSPVGKGRYEQNSVLRPLSPVSDVTTPTSPSPGPAMHTPRGPRPPSTISLANTNGRFPSDYLAKLNGSAMESNPPLRPPSRPLSASLTPDRYSGGLEYEWERGYGIGGSAGTRSSNSEAVIKSIPAKMVYGLDLTDVPVIVRKQVNST